MYVCKPYECSSQKTMSDPLELELWMAVSPSVWVLGMESRTFGISDCSRWAISPALVTLSVEGETEARRSPITCWSSALIKTLDCRHFPFPGTTPFLFPLLLRWSDHSKIPDDKVHGSEPNSPMKGKDRQALEDKHIGGTQSLGGNTQGSPPPSPFLSPDQTWGWLLPPHHTTEVWQAT